MARVHEIFNFKDNTIKPVCFHFHIHTRLYCHAQARLRHSGSLRLSQAHSGSLRLSQAHSGSLRLLLSDFDFDSEPGADTRFGLPPPPPTH